MRTFVVHHKDWDSETVLKLPVNTGEYPFAISLEHFYYGLYNNDIMDIFSRYSLNTGDFKLYDEIVKENQAADLLDQTNPDVNNEKMYGFKKQVTDTNQTTIYGDRYKNPQITDPDERQYLLPEEQFEIEFFDKRYTILKEDPPLYLRQIAITSPDIRGQYFSNGLGSNILGIANYDVGHDAFIYNNTLKDIAEINGSRQYIDIVLQTYDTATMDDYTNYVYFPSDYYMVFSVYMKNAF